MPREDILQCLRDCPHYWEVWNRLDMCQVDGFVSSIDASDWILKMACGNGATLFVAGIGGFVDGVIIWFLGRKLGAYIVLSRRSGYPMMSFWRGISKKAIHHSRNLTVH